MIDLQRTLESRFPHWFSGHRRRVSVSLVGALSRWSRVSEINEFLGRNAHLRGFAFVEAAMDHLGVRCLIDHVERERIPETGRCVIVANHPMGAIDALALLHCVGSVRRDIRVLANDLLSVIAPLSDMLLPLRILGGRPTADSLSAAELALAEEQALIIFPSGEVSRMGWRGVRDARWRRGFVQFAEGARAPIVPVYLSGRNSALFYGLSRVAAPLGTAMLPREMFARSGRRIEVRVGTPIQPEQVPGDTPHERANTVQRAVSALAHGRDILPKRFAAIGHAPRLRDQLADLRGLSELGRTPDGRRICAGRLDPDRPLMREIGRLRELTFRTVGEGSGRRLDVDRFDAHYDQLVLWDDDLNELVGAYRFGRCAPILKSHGLSGLYSASLFQFSDRFAEGLGDAMELGRSFVQPRYWGTRSLDELWVGIGAYLRAHPEVRRLFGPVSISAQLAEQARSLLVAYYRRFHGERQELAVSNRPLTIDATTNALFDDLDADAAMAVLRANLSALGARIPTLYKQYTELCEPGGARFLAFGTDPDFANAVDGLILVDLDRMTPKKRARYLEPRSDRRRAIGAAA